MTVSQAKEIDNKFVKLKDSIKILNLSLTEKKEVLTLTNDKLLTTDFDLAKTKDSLNNSLVLNQAYYKEIEKYRKMQFEDRKVLTTTKIGIGAALVIWLLVFVGSMGK